MDALLCSNPVPTATSLISKEYCFTEVHQTDCMSEIGQSLSCSNVRSQIGLSLAMEALGDRLVLSNAAWEVWLIINDLIRRPPT